MSDVTRIEPAVITFRRCPECGVLSVPDSTPMFQHDWECPHDCSDFDGWEDVKYVQPQAVADALRNRAATYSSRRTRGSFYMAADVVLDLFGEGSSS